MENIFSPKRFGSLFNKHFREHLRIYLMSLIVFGAIILASFIFSLANSNGLTLHIETQFVVCGVSLFLGVFIFAGNIFSDYNHPRSAFTATMLPASIFEKYLLYWSVSLIGFTILALGAYHLSQTVAIQYLKAQGAEPVRFFIWKVTNASPPSKHLFLFYLLLHSIAFLGAISFRKRTIIITALVAFMIIAAYMLLHYRISLIALNGNGVPLPFLSPYVLTEEGWAIINQSNNEIRGTISLGALVILLWTCAFFKLKERQV